MTRRMPAGVTVLAALFGAACAGSSDDDGCSGPGSICTWAGTGESAFNGDGLAALATSLYWPVDLAFAPDGRGYVLDWQNHRVRRVEADGRVQTVIGGDLPGDGPSDGSDMRPEGALGTNVELNHPTDIEFLPDGRLLLAAWHNHKIRRFDPATGLVHVICGSTPGDNADHVQAARAFLNQPKSVAVDPAGLIFVADSRNQRIRVIDGDGVITNAAGTGRSGFDGEGASPLQATFFMQTISENPEPGGSLTIDREGRLYLADTYNNRVRRIDFGAKTVTTIAGTGEAGFSGDGGPATAAALNRPRDLELGPDGRLYIADTDNHRVRVLDLATGVIRTVAGSGRAGFSGDGGPATAAGLDRPFGIAFDPAGDLFVADTFNDRIRRVVRP